MSSKKRKQLITELEHTDTTSKKEIKFTFLQECPSCNEEMEFHRGQVSKTCPNCGTDVKLIME